MALTFTQRKTVEITWDKEKVKGASVSIQVKEDVGSIELRSVENDEHATVTFPQSFTGVAHFVVKGSKSGEDSGSYHVQ